MLLLLKILNMKKCKSSNKIKRINNKPCQWESEEEISGGKESR